MKLLLKRENILPLVPFLFSLHIYFFKNDNPRWALTFQGISDSLESAAGFCWIWWTVLAVPFALHIQLSKKKRLNTVRWLHIILSAMSVAVFYWLFFEKIAVVPGWHTEVKPFYIRLGGYKISVVYFTLIAVAFAQIFFSLLFFYKNREK
jgi:hypothetical protein